MGGVLKDLSRRNNFSRHISTNYWGYFICFWPFVSFFATPCNPRGKSQHAIARLGRCWAQRRRSSWWRWWPKWGKEDLSSLTDTSSPWSAISCNFLPHRTQSCIFCPEQTAWAQVWVDQLCEGACVSTGDIKCNWKDLKPDFHIRCQCTTTWGNLRDGLQRKIALLRFTFMHFQSKARQCV